MQGRITKFREDIGFGVIKTADGRKFRFSTSAIKNRIGRLVGVDVDFLVDALTPREIFVLDGSPWTAFGAAR